MKIAIRTIARLFTVLVLVTSAATAVAEKSTISAVIPWQAQGQVFQTNSGKAQFLGSLEGIMYAENAEGEMDEAFVRCPIVQEINLEEGTSSTSGKCTIVVSPEDTVFAEITCEGSAGLCRGEFRFTGGAGRFEGIKGKGKLTARSPVHALASDLSGGVSIHVAAGILQMPELTVELP